MATIPPQKPETTAQEYRTLRSVFDALPSPAFIVDADCRLLEWNIAALSLVREDGTPTLRRRGGEALNCVNAASVPEGCGRAPTCRDCAVRNSVLEAVAGSRVCRKRTRMLLSAADGAREVHLLITAAPLESDNEPRVLLILEDISEIVALQSLLPVCAWCRRVRDSEQYWQSLEQYLKTHADVDFTHSICGDCYERLLKEGDRSR